MPTYSELLDQSSQSAPRAKKLMTSEDLRSLSQRDYCNDEQRREADKKISQNHVKIGKGAR